MNHTLISRRKQIALAVMGGMILTLWGPFIPSTHAAFQATIVRLDRMKAATATTGRVCAKPSVANLASTEAFVEVTFPAGFTVSSTAGNWTVTTTNLDSGQTVWPGIGTAVNVTGQTVRFPSTDLASSSTLYCFNWSGGTTLTNPSAANNLIGTVATRLTGPGAVIDQSGYALSVIADDQIAVTASVAASFTFALSANSAALGTLDPASTINSGTVTGTVTTNALGGWTAWVRDANSSGGNGALNSVAAGNYKIGGAAAVGTAARTLTNGTEDYGLGVTSTTHASGTGGTPTADAAYNSIASTKIGTLNPTVFSVLASNNGTSGGVGDTFVMILRSTISTLTPPASDYTDTITVVAAGTF
jgi:hypothetical protein